MASGGDHGGGDHGGADTKSALRAAILARRRTRPPAVRETADRARLDRLTAELDASGPRTVAAYLSFGAEPDTHALLDHLRARGLTVLLPAETAAPGWVDYRGPGDLEAGPRGRTVPCGAVRGPAALAEADLVICPGLAGTPTGDRLGRGGGWYDRALALRRPGVEAWLLLFDDEIVAALPTEPWDQRVDRIVTPSRTIRCALDRT